VQAGAVRAIADRLNEVKKTLTTLRKRQTEHEDARRDRKRLVEDLQRNRQNLFLERGVVLKRIASEANSYADDLTIRVSFDRAGTDTDWVTWLSETFGFRRPRVARLAAVLSPLDFSQQVISSSGRAKLLALQDIDKSPFFTGDQLDRAWTWEQTFHLEIAPAPVHRTL